MIKKVLLVCAHRPKRSPSQRYRFEQYLPLLREQGFDFTYSFLLDERSDKIFYAPGNYFKKAALLAGSIVKRMKDLSRLKEFDIVFIQREASFLGTSFFEKRAGRSKAYVIFDFDDSIWLADTSPANKKWEWLKSPGKFFKNVTYADAVIAGNNYLLEKARLANVAAAVIPTTIDTDIHIPKQHLRNGPQVVIGWSGSISTIKHFIELAPVLKKIREKYKDTVLFRVAADKIYTHPDIKIDGVKWSAETEVDVLNTFDIGIMPLPDDEWSRGKCGLKALSYMACGIATVMSPVGVNTEIILNRQNGLLADTAGDWFNALCFLIENKSERERLGEEGRKTVVARYSVIANYPKYLEIFRRAQSA